VVNDEVPHGTPFPERMSSRSPDPALTARFRKVVETVGTQAKAAAVAKVSLRQMKKYVAGVVTPSYVAAGHLAAATGYSLDWIMSGEGPERRVAHAKDSVRLPAKAEAAAVQWAGDQAALKVVTLLPFSGFFEAFDAEGYSLDEVDEEAIIEIARAMAKVLAPFPREEWPRMLKFLVEAQRAALRFAATHRPRLKRV
jgi:hypothetical protein